MERIKIAEYRFSSMAELEEFLKVAESCGYLWKSGSRPTKYDPLEMGMDCETDSIVLYSDNTMMHGPIEGDPVTFKNEIPTQVQVTGRPLRVTIEGRDYMLAPLDNSNRRVEAREEEHSVTVEELIAILQKAPNPQAEVRVWSTFNGISYAITEAEYHPSIDRVDLEFQQ